MKKPFFTEFCIFAETEKYMPTKTSIVSKILPEALGSENSGVFEIFATYKKMAGIVERTHIAMGKKQVIKFSTAPTDSEKAIINACSPTH